MLLGERYNDTKKTKIDEKENKDPYLIIFVITKYYTSIYLNDEILKSIMVSSRI